MPKKKQQQPPQRTSFRDFARFLSPRQVVSTFQNVGLATWASIALGCSIAIGGVTLLGGMRPLGVAITAGFPLFVLLLVFVHRKLPGVISAIISINLAFLFGGLLLSTPGMEYIHQGATWALLQVAWLSVAVCPTFFVFTTRSRWLWAILFQVVEFFTVLLLADYIYSHSISVAPILPIGLASAAVLILYWAVYFTGTVVSIPAAAKKPENDSEKEGVK